MVLLKDMNAFYRLPEGASRGVKAWIRPFGAFLKRIDGRLDAYRTR